MGPVVSWSMRRAPTIMFVLSLIVFALGLAVAYMTAHLTAQQAGNAMFGGATANMNGIARVQALGGVVTALQNALWPFAAGAITFAIQSRLDRSAD